MYNYYSKPEVFHRRRLAMYLHFNVAKLLFTFPFTGGKDQQPIYLHKNIHTLKTTSPSQEQSFLTL